VRLSRRQFTEISSELVEDALGATPSTHVMGELFFASSNDFYTSSSTPRNPTAW
jgi:hypothetical protein